MFVKTNVVHSDAPAGKPTFRQLSAALVAVWIFTSAGSVHAAENKTSVNAVEERNRIVALVRHEGVDAIPELEKAIDSDSKIVRYTAAQLLVNVGEPAYDALSRNLTHEDVQVRYIMIDGLENLGVVDQHIEELVLDKNAVVRRRFYLDIMPRHLLVDGEPSDALIESLTSAYDDGSERIRYEIIKAVADLPLTEASRALLRRASNQEKAVVAAEGDEEEIGDAEKTALIAFRTLLEIDIEKMRNLADKGEWQQLVDEFGERDFTEWPDTTGRGRNIPGTRFYANEPAEAYHWLARAYFEIWQPEKTEKVLRELIKGGEVSLGISHGRERSFYRRLLALYGENYQKFLREDEKVRDRYVKMQLDYGNMLAEAGREGEARKSYKRALQVEGIPAELKKAVNKAIAELK